MSYNSLLEKLVMQSANERDAPSIIDTAGRVLSRQEILHEVNVVARGFMAAGLQPGERVLFAVRPDAGAILLMLGILEAGGVLVPMDSTMGPELFKSRMDLLAPQWVVAESLLYSASSSSWIVRLLDRRGIKLPPLAEIKGAKFVRVGRNWPGVPPSLSLEELKKLGTASGDSMRVAINDNAAAIIVFTSGTTGAPKAVVHTRRSLRNIFDTVESLLNTSNGDVIYARELHLILPTLFVGSMVVVPNRSGFSAKHTLKDLKKFSITHIFGVPAEFQQLIDYLVTHRQKLPSSLREIWIGAAPVHAAFLKNLQTVIVSDANICCVYGMTEILPVARVSLAEKVKYEGEGDLVGECIAGVSARVSANGELLLRGPNLFFGYFGEPACTEHATGDLACLQEGRIVLLGRRKDMIIRRQFNIYPELYESTIERIAGVRRCAMVGIYDEVMADERIVLAVEPGADVDAATLEKRLRQELRSGPFSIDSAALPDDILVMELPVAGRSSKVDKNSIREFAQRATSCVSP